MRAARRAPVRRDHLGEYQVQTAIAALDADAQSTSETDWVQIMEWNDQLLRVTGSPVVQFNRMGVPRRAGYLRRSASARR